MKKLSSEPAKRIGQLDKSTRRLTIASLLTLVSVFGAGGIWITTAQLESAAIAPGVVVVQSQRKTIKHLEGGIVEAILVSEGDRVKANQVMVQLDPTRAKANLDLLQGHHYAALALEDRLRAERDRVDNITFVKFLLDNQGDERVHDAIRGEQGIFVARRDAIIGQTAILNQKIAQLAEEIGGLQAQQKAERRQWKFIQEEISDQQKLYDKGHARKSRMLALKREAARLEGSRGQHLASIARAKQSIAEADLSILDLQNRRSSEVASKLREAEGEVDELEERLRSATDVLARTKIRAPQPGIVADLHIHTPGGVIQPGEPLMEMVPENDELVIEARVSPNDIDVVVVGMLAQIRLTAFNRRSTPTIDGLVTYVSADRLQDGPNGIPYYKTLVRVDPESLAKLDNVKLYPGMPADAYIATGSRTALNYFLSPITDSMARAMREN